MANQSQENSEVEKIRKREKELQNKVLKDYLAVVQYEQEDERSALDEKIKEDNIKADLYDSNIKGLFSYSNRYKAGIKNNLTKTFIPFAVMPEGLSESVSATFTQQNIVGASVPRIIYSNTQAKTLSLSLKNLTEDYIPKRFF